MLTDRLPPHDIEAEEAVNYKTAGYEGRFMRLAFAWPDVVLPIAVARQLNLEDLNFGEDCELYSWLLDRWQRNEVVEWGFQRFVYERLQAFEQPDTYYQHWDRWCHFGDTRYPDQWCAPEGAYWPELTALVANLLIDKLFAFTFRRRFGGVLWRLGMAIRVGEPRHGLAVLLAEYRRAAQRARPVARIAQVSPPTKHTFQDAGVL